MVFYLIVITVINRMKPRLLIAAAAAFLVAVSPYTLPDALPAEGEDGPAISDLKVSPDAGFAGTIYTITLRVTDPQGPQDIEETLYHVRESKEWIKVRINDAGVEGDVRKGDGIYTGKSVVPTSADISTHRFRVHVRDRSGNRSNALTYTFTVLVTFSI